MMRRTARLIMALALGYALLAPAGARADGPVDPIATNFAARVSHAPVGVQAKVIDGYLQLWLRVDPSQRVVVLDQLGAPWLRFAPSGVWVNHNSLLFYDSQIPVEAIPPAHINAATPPHWVRVSSGHEWMWRDGRLQAFARQTPVPGQRYAGRWSIGLRIAGQVTNVSGGFFDLPHPSPVWFWPVAVILLCVLAAWRVRSGRLDRRMVSALTLVLLGALLVVAATRLLHGRPSVSAVQVVEFAVALGAILATAATFLRGRFRVALPLLVALMALWAGLTFAPILTHQDLQLIGPGWLSRGATALLLGGGAGLGLVAMRRPGLPTPDPR